MATTSYTSWAADLAEVGAVYPFVGTEVVMVILGVVFWLTCQIMMAKMEKEELEAEEKSANAESSSANIDRY